MKVKELLSVQTQAHFLAGLEVGHALARYIYRFTRARVAALAGIPFARGERAKAAQFDTSAFCKACCDFIEKDVDDLFDFFSTQRFAFARQCLKQL